MKKKLVLTVQRGINNMNRKIKVVMIACALTSAGFFIGCGVGQFITISKLAEHDDREFNKIVSILNSSKLGFVNERN